MMARNALAAALGFAALVSTAPVLADGDPSAGIVGVWQNPDGSEITIAACPDDYCGSLSKIVVPKNEYDKLTAAQRAAVDKMDPAQFPDQRNKDPALRTRTLLGLQLFTLHPSAKPTEFDGSMYNPQDGNTYDGYMIVVDPNKVKVGGCVLKVLCRDQEWTRAPEQDQQAADASAAPTPKPASAKPKAAGTAADPGGF
jgi:uncharacterized protein (DUF2147 family)